MTLGDIVADFAVGIMHADARRPVAINNRSKKQFRPGIGPHSEAKTIELVMTELKKLKPNLYAERVCLAVPYPERPRQKCDLCLGRPNAWDWAIEVKILRILGDNGKANDNILMHIFSPYPQHRSAVQDCLKLAATSMASKRAILIYGYAAEAWPLDPAIEAFEVLASHQVRLGTRQHADFSGLVHPIHTSGRVYGWEIQGEPKEAIH
jgi:hypothetical protein